MTRRTLRAARRQVHRRLAGRVAAADDDHVLAAAPLGVGGHGGVVDARAREPLDVVGVELAPARTGGDHDRAGERVLPVVEVDANEPLRATRRARPRGESSTAPRRNGGPAASPCASARCRRSRSGSQGSSRSACWCRPGRRAPTPRPRVSAVPRSPPYTAAASPAGPPPSTTRSNRSPSISARRPRSRATWAAEGLRSTAVLRTRIGVSSRGIRSQLEHRLALLVGVDVVPPHRYEVALEQVTHLEGAA